jgi:tetratricopeptide (TPR) repeat protein
MRRTSRTLLFLLVASALALPVSGQDWRGRARLDGWVKDAKGQPIADAKVELKKESGAGPSAVRTNKKGYWAVLGLVGGPWNVDVSAPGYETRKLAVSLSEASRVPPMMIELEPSGPSAPAAGAAPPDAGAEIRAAVEHGNQLLAEKKYVEARAEYEKALQKLPGSTAILKGIAQTYGAEGNSDKAIETLREIAVLDANDHDNRVLLASLLLEQGKLEEGKGVLETLPPGAIRDAGIYVNLGILFMNKNAPETARVYLTRAIEIDPADADSYRYRGLASVQAKKNAEAKADLKKYLELAPDGADAKEVREILQALR